MGAGHPRRLPAGAEVTPGGVHFRVWAPQHQRVSVVFEGPGAPAELALEPEGGQGYFSGLAPGARAGALYRYRVDGGDRAYADPASRFQPHGPHGPSQVVDPGGFRWSDAGWRGARLAGQVLYEMHVGTFTREGTFQAACRELDELAAAGISAVELMPLADFPGRFNWGYDGVNPFAPAHTYGAPDDLRRMVERAHALGIAVILDVVYNHLGPDGCYLMQFSPYYLSDRHKTGWGDAINFDGPHSGPVREYFLANAGYWIDEYHMDGLRLDATQDIYDESPEHILAAVAQRVRAAAGGRDTIVVAENESQDTALVRPREAGGCALDGLWNDDFHHSAAVALTGRREAYYTDYLGRPAEFIAAARWGYLYQGQRYKWQRKRRGTPAFGLPACTFVTFLENHDQVANSARGLRMHQQSGPGRYRALTALWLLMPGTPMFFQGQEFAASSPFLFFADHKPELAALVRKGRADFLEQFPSIAVPEVRAALADPGAPETFERCKLDFSERQSHAAAYALHRDLLRVRREDAVLRAQGPLDGAVLAERAFLLRYWAPDGGDRLLVVNLGADLHLEVAPEPLLAPPRGMRWQPLWSSEDPRYGGLGTPPLDSEDNWHLPAESAVLLAPHPAGDEPDPFYPRAEADVRARQPS